MDPWRLLGRAILMGVDALGAGLIAGLLAFFLVPITLVENRVVVAFTVAGVVAGVTLAVALALAETGRRPFPATRLARLTLARLPWWWP